MSDFEKTKIKCQQLKQDDRFRLAGVLHTVTSTDPTGGFRGDRVHISAIPVGGDPRYDRISIFFPPNTKMTVYAKM
jgi:hypothetical protein